MAVGAQPSDIIRILKRKRARGQEVQPYEYREALRSYWDVQASRRQQDKSLAQTDRQLDLREEAMKDAKDAAKVAGIAELGSTAAIGAMALKGTRFGSKIGLGAAEGAATSSAITSGGAQIGGLVAPSYTGESAATSAFGGLGPSTEAVTTGMGSTGSAISATSVLGPAGIGLATGFIGSKLTGDKKSSAITGAALGVGGGWMAGAAAGGTMGGPIGALIGGLVGGVSGKIKG